MMASCVLELRIFFGLVLVKVDPIYYSIYFKRWFSVKPLPFLSSSFFISGS